jgi:zinc/manganese transport system substrate-binding protein
MPRRVLFALLSLLAAGLTHAAPIKVVASFSILGDFVREVGGERVQLRVLAGPGQDAHLYEPRPADVAAVAAADLVVVNGLHFEGFLERLMKAGAGKAPVASLSDGAPQAKPADPHAWQSVANAQVYVRNLADALCGVDAAGCAYYRARAQDYARRLNELDAELRAELGSLPPSRRVFLTAHSAFQYFGHAYGLSFLSPAGLSTDAEATAADMRRLVEQLRGQQVTGIFVEHGANPRLLRRLAAEAGMKIGGTLYADTLSAPGGEADTYIEMMRHNGRVIGAAARQSAP